MQPVTEKAKKDKMLSIAAISAVHKFQYLLFAKCYLKTSFERKKSYFQTAAEHTTYCRDIFSPALFNSPLFFSFFESCNCGFFVMSVSYSTFSPSPPMR